MRSGKHSLTDIPMTDIPMTDTPNADTSVTDTYEDMIYLPHHESQKHPRMSMEDRAAQFAPFAALTGHGDAVRETAREVMEDTK